MKLYHAGVSTCSQKVRLVLAEKSLDYDSQFVDLQQGGQFAADYLRKNPAGVVPTLEDQGLTLVESTLINEYLDDAYPEVSLRPVAPGLRHQMRLWCKKIDELHPHCGVQTYAIGARPGLLARPADEVARLVAAIPDPARRALRRSVIDDGVRAPAFVDAYAAHDRFFADVDAALQSGDWLVGDDFSLADAALLPYVLRVDHLGLSALLEERPSLLGWYQRICARPSYEVAVAALLPDAVVKAFRAAGAAVADDVATLVASNE